MIYSKKNKFTFIVHTHRYQRRIEFFNHVTWSSTNHFHFFSFHPHFCKKKKLCSKLSNICFLLLFYNHLLLIISTTVYLYHFIWLYIFSLIVSVFCFCFFPCFYHFPALCYVYKKKVEREERRGRKMKMKKTANLRMNY